MALYAKQDGKIPPSWDSDNGRAKAGLDIGVGPRLLICASFGR